MRGRTNMAAGGGAAKMCHVKITPRPNEIPPGACDLYDFWYFNGEELIHEENGDLEVENQIWEFDMPQGLICTSEYYNGGTSIAWGDAERHTIVSTMNDNIGVIYVFGDCEIYH